MNVEEVIKSGVMLPPDRRTIIHLLLVGNRINDALSQSLKPFGVSLQQFNVLRILRGQKGEPANLSTLNERMVHKMSNTTRLVDKLISRGFVDRQVCPSNRRKVEITITTAGEKALTQMDQAIDQTQSELTRDFDDEMLATLNELLDKF
ncbi:DNA-binding transcriptional regulator, MarR family [Robiginitalea myxolifaciens]|uniref:DNA-binding transcriptional regulator, MarR family n=1 Tax=Robiginitalea myxolifaciens TaxID=400055 RepID=A0A1I6FPI9_9FLAO|nr:MarR family transcriptional regulator [Robiginitalea myxolifaciens]SFR31707.1 DNA-binding transcriptional regulator, MarR family [Robiginitalea myxolifaciens]